VASAAACGRAVAGHAKKSGGNAKRAHPDQVPVTASEQNMARGVMITARAAAGPRHWWRSRWATPTGALAVACPALGVAGTAPTAGPAQASVRAGGYTAAGGRSGVGPVTEVSKCPGRNAEVQEGTAPPAYVYVTWIGCGGEGFARSVDGGTTFQKP